MAILFSIMGLVITFFIFSFDKHRAVKYKRIVTEYYLLTFTFIVEF